MEVRVFQSLEELQNEPFTSAMEPLAIFDCNELSLFKSKFGKFPLLFFLVCHISSSAGRLTTPHLPLV
ncbi:hypothetical protein A2U01_0032647 [Trifolium medium]|uniref:Uncharacterized protein n=1 Tax=Trifolium medium TaxID=97028 RepID=A0A392PJS0_9FABA|nr:hypothetical protein [Trifolium medium]